MKYCLWLTILTTLSTSALARFSLNPDKTVTPLLDIFSSGNKILRDSNVEVKVTTFSDKGVIKKNGGKTKIPKSQYDQLRLLGKSVLEMIEPEKSNKATFRMGTAFHIGNNLVLTNHHVLSVDRTNFSQCDDFQLKDPNSNRFFACKKVHFCSTEHDVCLIEMDKLKQGPFNRKLVRLSDGPSLKLRSTYSPAEPDKVVLTAIGNSGGLGIHASQGRGFGTNFQGTVFYAPVSVGNSGGPLLDEQGLVVGLVYAQSKPEGFRGTNYVGMDAYNAAVSVENLISIIRDALNLDPETLGKFNASVIE